MSDTEILVRKIDAMAENMKLMAQALGTRLSREQMCDRLGVHRNTLAKMSQEHGFPQPDRTGKWLLSEVIEWETRR
jgi:predicted DNA-binding transcriptional regulator AlpA